MAAPVRVRDASQPRGNRSALRFLGTRKGPPAGTPGGRHDAGLDRAGVGCPHSRDGWRQEGIAGRGLLRSPGWVNGSCSTEDAGCQLGEGRSPVPLIGRGTSLLPAVAPRITTPSPPGKHQVRGARPSEGLDCDPRRAFDPTADWSPTRPKVPAPSPATVATGIEEPGAPRGHPNHLAAPAGRIREWLPCLRRDRQNSHARRYSATSSTQGLRERSVPIRTPSSSRTSGSASRRSPRGPRG